MVFKIEQAARDNSPNVTDATWSQDARETDEKREVLKWAEHAKFQTHAFKDWKDDDRQRFTPRTLKDE